MRRLGHHEPVLGTRRSHSSSTCRIICCSSKAVNTHLYSRSAVSCGVRAATGADLQAITAIYNYYVANSTCTFELDPVTPIEMHDRFQDIVSKNHPYIVATAQNGLVVGYAYASTFRSRPAYRYTVENSVYVDKEYQGQGIGHLLLYSLLQECEGRDLRQMIACIAREQGSLSNRSIAMHEKLGFCQTGHMPSVGFKHGRWLDVVFMQRAIGEGVGSLPAGEACKPCHTAAAEHMHQHIDDNSWGDNDHARLVLSYSLASDR